MKGLSIRMVFSPIIASKEITEEYYRYLSTIFNIDDPVFESNLKEKLGGRDTTFSKGPYLEVTDAFEQGETVADLIKDGILPNGFERLGFPTERPLYLHQAQSLKCVLRGRNVVVSTGTGSGKTESFLLPILSTLVKEYNEGILSPGVRAMLIYPMNALANDQVERMRGVLADFPEITFGCYTGQTVEHYKDAIVSYNSLNGGDPPSNELISREQMKETPPHILITNYAMLEYLMVRPDDSVFFSEQYTKHWKYIVLDEAHIYKGATGIEVAMLLRRLIARLHKQDIQFVLTSATLGGENDNKAVADFASNLCNTDFTEKDIIRAISAEQKPSSFLKLPPGFYHNVAELIDIDTNPESILRTVNETVPVQAESLEEALYKIVRHDEFYWKVRIALMEPKTVKDLLAEIKCEESDLADFVTVATRAVHNGSKLFDARYHLFLKAAESVYITFSPRKQLFLESRKTYFENGESYKVFEAAICNHCNALYLLGRESDHGTLEQATMGLDEEPRSAYLVSGEVNDTDDEHTMEDAGEELEAFDLCTICGALKRPGSRLSCGHDNKAIIRVQRVHLKEGTERLTKCPKCENVSSTGILRQFFVGQEAVTSVIGTSLFEKLPAYTIEHKESVVEDISGFDSGFDFEEETRHDVGAKQFIAFSDSRQAAAFYATYLDQTYTNIVYKRLVIETLKKREYNAAGKSLDDFVEDLIAQFELNHMAESNKLRKEAWKAALHEAVDNNGVTSLYKMGMIHFDIPDEGIRENKRFNLSKEEVHEICALFVDWMMSEGAILYPEAMNMDERSFFAPSGIEYSYTLSDSDPKKYTLSFMPSREGFSNKRLDYLSRLLNKKGMRPSEAELKALLEGFWKAFFIRPGTGLLTAKDGKYKLKSDRVIVKKPSIIFRCEKCRRIAHHNNAGMCTSYRCTGELKPFKPEEAFRDNHYYHLYQELDIRPLRVVEHTAQLDRETAYSYQSDFKQKKIDILSCSTTFEMGVDVGSLETVFMRNVPPSPANYAQRAGRAGRSLKSAAFAVTFCNKSNHDFSYFVNPNRMIRGRIDPPVFDINNSKIAIRHVYASAFSFFWKKNSAYFSNVYNFLNHNESGSSGDAAFCEYLDSQPTDLRDYLMAFLPPTLAKEFDVENYGWVSTLTSAEDGILTRAVESYDEEIRELEEARKRNYETMKGGVDNLSQRIRVYQRETILAYLARKNIFPRYGFPVDTVEMTLIDRSGNLRAGLQLQRDLAMAISEYAPGSQIVANGKLITSRYIKKRPDRSWKMNRYCICGVCGDLNTSFYNEGDGTYSKTCKICGNKLDGVNAGVYLIPEFGFEADGDGIRKPGLRKPVRTYRSDVSYSGADIPEEEQQIEIGSSARIIVRPGKNEEMVVINRSHFFVCESCGYTELNEKSFRNYMTKEHKRSSGYRCGNRSLKRFSLAYRFQTDILVLRFMNPEICEEDVALSVLYGILEGVSKALSIDRDDISGCLKWFYNPESKTPNYSFVLYDKTPGGAGHVRRVSDKSTLTAVLQETYALMKACTCGGEEMDTSCYSCLRNYYNQKYHDELQRGYVIHFLEDVLG